VKSSKTTVDSVLSIKTFTNKYIRLILSTFGFPGESTL
jgi:hypothetical protein